MPATRLEQWRVDLKPDTDNMFLKKRLVNSLETEMGKFVLMELSSTPSTNWLGEMIPG